MNFAQILIIPASATLAICIYLMLSAAFRSRQSDRS